MNKDNFHCPCSHGLKLKSVSISNPNPFEKSGLTRKRAYRDRILQPDAIRFILKEAKVQFPTKILKAFLNSISLFPFNTYVKLNNKSIGRVIATHRNHPLRPAVEVLYDGLGNMPERKEIVRLSDNPLLYIVETIDERDLK